jgi:hypothetical protein
MKCDKEMGRRYSDQARTVQTLTRLATLCQGNRHHSIPLTVRKATG